MDLDFIAPQPDHGYGTYDQHSDVAYPEQAQYSEPTEDENYLKLAHIGEGSYADVYLATPRHPQLLGKKAYVIKELDVMSMEEKDQRKAVLEVNILSTLSHPNIIGYRESYIHDGFLCIVMEHADGGDLFHHICHARESGYWIEQKVILSWLAQILLALQYVHSNSLLHRDIKPQNIFLLQNGMVKLGDFGVSRVLEHPSSLASTTTGTPCYFSPELCRNEPYDAKSDIWALGCITYEMAALTPPFPSEDMAQMCRDIINSEPVPLPPDYSNELRVMIKMMMEKQAVHRPSAEQMLQVPALRKVCKRLPWARAQTTACLVGQRRKHRKSSTRKSRFRERAGSLPGIEKPDKIRNSSCVGINLPPLASINESASPSSQPTSFQPKPPTRAKGGLAAIMVAAANDVNEYDGSEPIGQEADHQIYRDDTALGDKAHKSKCKDRKREKRKERKGHKTGHGNKDQANKVKKRLSICTGENEPRKHKPAALSPRSANERIQTLEADDKASSKNILTKFGPLPPLSIKQRAE